MEWIRYQGLQDYKKIDLQMNDLLSKIIENNAESKALLLEFNHIYTIGSNNGDKEFGQLIMHKNDPSNFKRKNCSDNVQYIEHIIHKDSAMACKIKVPIIVSDRGGKITYHGPGQRVVYPIINLPKTLIGKDVKKYVHYLEKLLIDILDYFGLEGFTMPGHVGIWVMHESKPHKIAAIGVRIRKWVAYHGFAMNINPDLTFFDEIIPCGIREYGVTSLKQIGIEPSMDEFDKILMNKMNQITI